MKKSHDKREKSSVAKRVLQPKYRIRVEKDRKKFEETKKFVYDSSDDDSK